VLVVVYFSLFLEFGFCSLLVVLPPPLCSSSQVGTIVTCWLLWLGIMFVVTYFFKALKCLSRIGGRRIILAQGNAPGNERSE
jgi:hypothetical protein